MPVPGDADCCSELWLPSVVVRNVEVRKLSMLLVVVVFFISLYSTTEAWTRFCFSLFFSTHFFYFFTFYKNINSGVPTRTHSAVHHRGVPRWRGFVARRSVSLCFVVHSGGKGEKSFKKCVFSFPHPPSISSKIKPKPTPTAVRANMYTTLDVRAFPFDTQTLDLHLQHIQSDPELSRVEWIPSSRGLRIFTIGAGDDLSGFEAKNVFIFVTNDPFPRQFNDPELKNQVVARSARGDPAPLNPAKGINASAAFGYDKRVTDITIAVVVKRISLYYVLGMIVPILLLASLASKFFRWFGVGKEKRTTARRCLSSLFFSQPQPRPLTSSPSKKKKKKKQSPLPVLTLFIDPRLIETRLTSILSLYLANVGEFLFFHLLFQLNSSKLWFLLVHLFFPLLLSPKSALLFVFESDLPRSSYVLPLRQLALLSHILLFALALETIVVYNIESLSDVKAHFSAMRAASMARAELLRRKEAEAERQRERQQRERRQAVLVRGASGGGGGGGNGSGSTTNHSREPQLARRLSGALLSRWPSTIEIPPIRRPWAANRSAPASSGLEASAAAALATRAAEEGLRRGNGDDGVGASKAATTTITTSTQPPLTRETTTLSASTQQRREHEEEDQGEDHEAKKRRLLLEDELRRGYHSYLSFLIDLSCAFIFGFIYVLSAVLIFLISSRMAPGVCKLAGVAGPACEASAAMERDERDGV